MSCILTLTSALPLQDDAWKGFRLASDPVVRDRHVLIVGALGACPGTGHDYHEPLLALGTTTMDPHRGSPWCVPWPF